MVNSADKKRGMQLSAIAVQGMIESQARLENAGQRLASVGEISPPGVQPDTVDLSAEAVSLLNARDEFSLNVAMLKKANDIERQAIDLLL